MKYTPLQELRDIYPTGEENANDAFSVPDPPAINIDQAYETTSPTSIQFRGKYPENYINFAKRELTNVKRANFNNSDGSPLTFQFIINFADPDGTPDLWTSNTFADRLERASRDDNPYFTLDRVPVVMIPFRQLAGYYTGFKCGENYAEVSILRTIGLPDDVDIVKQEMVRHISWMVSSKEELRPIPEFGQWQINTTATLGREFADCIKEEAVGDSLDGFNPNNFPIADPDGVLEFEFDNSYFEGINRLQDPRSSFDFDGSVRGEDNTDPREDGPISDGETREDTRSSNDFDSTRGEDNTDTRDPNTTVDGDTRSTGDYTVGYEGRTGTETSNTTLRDWSNTEPIEVRSTSGWTGGTYYPFTTAGNYVGETRTYNRQDYIWTADGRWAPL